MASTRAMGSQKMTHPSPESQIEKIRTPYKDSECVVASKSSTSPTEIESEDNTVSSTDGTQESSIDVMLPEGTMNVEDCDSESSPDENVGEGIKPFGQSIAIKKRTITLEHAMVKGIIASNEHIMAPMQATTQLSWPSEQKPAESAFVFGGPVSQTMDELNDEFEDATEGFQASQQKLRTRCPSPFEGADQTSPDPTYQAISSRKYNVPSRFIEAHDGYRMSTLPLRIGISRAHHQGPIASDHETLRENTIIFQEETTPPPEIPSWRDVPAGHLPRKLKAPDSPKYEFRSFPRENMRFKSSTWIDQDDTGTYDPKGKHDPGFKMPPVDLERKKRERPVRDPTYEAPKRQKIKTWQQGRFKGDPFVVILHINSADGKAKLQAFGDSLNNWPLFQYSTNTPSAEDWRDWYNAKHLRRTPGLRQRSSADPLTRSLSVETSNLADVSLGHPEARGCKPCAALRLRCSLLDECAAGPCESCQEDGEDCVPLIEPKIKDACWECMKKKVVCSYRREGSDHSFPCQRCSDKGFPCVARPASRLMILRSPPDAVESNESTKALAKSRTHSRNVPVKSRAKCLSCRQDGKRCSRLGESQDAPCSYCQYNGFSCSFESSRTPFSTFSDPTAISPRISGEQSRLEEPRESFFMRTKLAQPIIFNCDLGCNWCQSERFGIELYGLLGIKEVNVEVMDSPDGRGYVEIRGGHREMGENESQMCEICTAHRMAILECGVHTMEPLKDTDPKYAELEVYVQWYDAVEADRVPFQWCSICATPAFYRCCAKGDGTGMAVALGREDGCGLLLCEACKETLVKDHGGDLARLTAGLRANAEPTLRADVEFLEPMGELNRQVPYLYPSFN